MIKILLCIEDQKILNKTSLVFKKLGFDVETLSTEIGLQEKLLGFKADVVMASGYGQKVSPINIGKKLNEWGSFKRGVKYVVMLNNQLKISPAELASTRIHGYLNVNSSFEKTLEVVCKAVGSDHVPLVEKFQKLFQSEQLGLNEEPKSESENINKGGASVTDLKPTNKSVETSGIKVPSSESDHDRVQKYLTHLQDLPKKTIESISRAEARKRAKEMSKDWDMEDLEFLDAEKREFVRALLKKPS